MDLDNNQVDSNTDFASSELVNGGRDALENTSFHTTPEQRQQREEQEEHEPNFTEEINQEYRDKTRRLQKEKFRARLEAQNWAEAAHYWKGEADKLQTYASQSSDAALDQMDQNINSLLSQAKENKKRALEEGDTDLAIQADMDMSRAMARLETLDNHYREREIERQQYLSAVQEAEMQKQYQYAQPQVAPEIDVPVEAEYLVKVNPWMDPRRPEFDPHKVDSLYSFTRELDQALAQQGRTHEYFSPAYVNEVNKFIRNNLSNNDQSSPPREQRSQQKSFNNNVSPVSGSRGYGASSRPKERFVLTEDEKFMARNAGLSEETWLKHKIDDIKTGKGNRNNYGQ